MIAKKPFGTTTDGKAVSLFTLTNRNGIEMQVINYGCIVVSLKTPDKNGNMEDIVLGFETLEQYVAESPFFGALIGRYGNRIAKGEFTLDGETYSLAINNPPNHLHGGIKSFDKVVWDVKEVLSDEGPALVFHYVSIDGEEGYPGTVYVKVQYTLTNENEFKINIEATTDKKTVINVCQHSYFNLVGNATRDVLDHEVYINADRFVVIDETSIPTGELRSVANTSFDFREPTAVGKHIHDDAEQIRHGNGYDHTFVFNEDVQKENALAASLYEPITGRTLEVFTQEPGVQFYTGNFLKGYKGKRGAIYHKRYGLCLETQHFPDSPNRPEFPSVILKPGDVYKTQTVYRFGVRE